MPPIGAGAHHVPLGLLGFRGFAGLGGGGGGVSGFRGSGFLVSGSGCRVEGFRVEGVGSSSLTVLMRFDGVLKWAL